jgi:hypothetical protein
MYVFTRGRIQTKPVCNWLHGKLEIWADMSPLLTTGQASSLGEYWEAETTLSGIPAMDMGHGKPIAVNDAMFVNPLATNTVTTSPI